MPSAELNSRDRHNIVIKAWRPIQFTCLQPEFWLTSEKLVCVSSGRDPPCSDFFQAADGPGEVVSWSSSSVLLSWVLHMIHLVPSALHAAIIRTSFVRTVGTIPVVLCEMMIHWGKSWWLRVRKRKRKWISWGMVLKVLMFCQDLLRREMW